MEKKNKYDYSLRPRYCCMCKQSYMSKNGEILHKSCDKLKFWTGEFMIHLICDKCLSVVGYSLAKTIHKPYMLTGCIEEDKQRDHYKYYVNLTCANKDTVTGEDHIKLEELLNTRVIWKEDGSYVVKVIDDEFERIQYDQFFEKRLADDETLRLYDKLEMKYREILAEREIKELNSKIDLSKDDDPEEI